MEQEWATEETADVSEMSNQNKSSFEATLVLYGYDAPYSKYTVSL